MLSARSGSGGSVFAFVRFKLEREAFRAIKKGSGMFLGGRRLVVFTAKDSRRARDGVRGVSDVRPLKDRGVSDPREFAFINGRSFKEVVLGGGSKHLPDSDMPSRLAAVVGVSEGSKDRNELEGDGVLNDLVMSDKDVELSSGSVMFSKSISLSVDIPECEMAWLNYSVVGKVKPGFSCNAIQNALCEVNISSELFNKWFFSLVAWMDFNEDREFMSWFRLEEVPLALRHVNFFRAVGDSFGSFVSIRECTSKRWNLEVAWIRIRSKSLYGIPVWLKGVCNGISFSIRVSLEPVSDGFFAGVLSPSGSASRSLDEEDDDVSSSPILDIVPDSFGPTMVFNDNNGEAAPYYREERTVCVDSPHASKNVRFVGSLNFLARGKQLQTIGSHSGPVDVSVDLGLADCERADPEGLVSQSPCVNKWIKPNKSKKGNRSLAQRNKKKDKRKFKFCGQNVVLEPIRDKPEFGEGQSKHTSGSCNDDEESDPEAEADWSAASQIISWNVRGLGRPEKKRSVRSLVTKECPSLICIHESKMAEFNNKSLKALWGKGSFSSEFVSSVGSAGGLVMLWSDKVFQLDSVIKNDRFIILFGSMSGISRKVALASVYDPNSESERRDFFANFSEIVNQHDFLWVVAGDFNVVTCEEERIGLSFSASSSQDFHGAPISVLLKDVKKDLREWQKLNCNKGVADINRVEGEIQPLEEGWAANLNDVSVSRWEMGSWRHASALWKHIIKPLSPHSSDFHVWAANSGFVLGNGANISFWHTEWILGHTLKVSFPRIFALAVNKLGTSSIALSDIIMAPNMATVPCKTAAPHQLRRYFFQIGNITRGQTNWMVTHILKESNSMADELAKAGIALLSDSSLDLLRSRDSWQLFALFPW
ncbi:Endonuclease/exonuclease/phosphatase [Corchorus olitorius]|uniref:Endonuclease/exonuclease/phosphatase n=1 Tax=Corchorus olitorius TaxID=93759 RepID=A0A1R3HID3_9ROSI|nr:Endonuclease/exonuclease/phosphatase [Corchorus olitorius]